MSQEIQLLPHQWKSVHSKAQHVLLLGGIGSGKSFALVCFMMKMYKEYPKSLGLITANTYGQLKKATLAAVFKNLTEWGISFQYNQMSSLLTIEGTKRFLCLSAENYDAHRGIEVGEWLADEAAYYSKEAYDVFAGRLRDKRGSLQSLFVSSPNGFNWLYDLFIKEGSNNPMYETISATTENNPHLPRGYIEHLKSTYSESQIEQELMGKFVNISSGKTYYAFDREKNVCDNVSLARGTVFIGMDFNVGFMCSVVLQFLNDKLYIYDEVTLRDSDTYQMANELRKRGYGGATVIPDSTAANRKTSGQSDFEILRQAGFTIKSTRNPFVMDRVNCVNKLLRDEEIIISSKCKVLIADLEQVVWKGNKLDQSGQSKDLTHISDALGYAANMLKPLRSKPRAIFTRDR